MNVMILMPDWRWEEIKEAIHELHEHDRSTNHADLCDYVDTIMVGETAQRNARQYESIISNVGCGA